MRSRKLILTLALMACMGGLAAQSDGFFRSSSQEETRDEGTIGNLSNQTFGKTPLGDGLLLLTIAGAGYAALKRRKQNN